MQLLNAIFSPPAHDVGVSAAPSFLLKPLRFVFMRCRELLFSGVTAPVMLGTKGLARAALVPAGPPQCSRPQQQV